MEIRSTWNGRTGRTRRTHELTCNTIRSFLRNGRPRVEFMRKDEHLKEVNQLQKRIDKLKEKSKEKLQAHKQQMAEKEHECDKAVQEARQASEDAIREAYAEAEAMKRKVMESTEEAMRAQAEGFRNDVASMQERHDEVINVLRKERDRAVKHAEKRAIEAEAMEKIWKEKCNSMTKELELTKSALTRAYGAVEAVKGDISKFFEGPDGKEAEAAAMHRLEKEELMRIATDPRMQGLFRLWDTDGSGSIDLKELCLGIRKFQKKARLDESALAAASLMLHYDKDTNQTLDRSEFAQFLFDYAKAAKVKFSDVADFLLLHTAHAIEDEAEKAALEELQPRVEELLRSIEKARPSSQSEGAPKLPPRSP